MISLKPIRENAGPPAYTRGNQVYKRGLVHEFTSANQGSLIEAEAQVEGSHDNSYHVKLVYDRVADDFLEYSCECEAFYTYNGMCKHCVGTALELLEQEQGQAGKESSTEFMGWKIRENLQETDRQVADFIRSRSTKEKSRFFQAEVTGRMELIPTLHYWDRQGWQVEFRIGADHFYVVKNISAMVDAVRDQAHVEYGKKLKFYHQPEVFSPESRRVLQFLEECVRQERQALNRYYGQMGNSFSFYRVRDSLTSRMMQLDGERMVRFAQLFAGKECALEDYRGNEKIRFVEQDPQLSFSVEETKEGGCQLHVPKAAAYFGVDRLCIQKEKVIFLCSREFSEDMWEAARLLNGKKQTFWINPLDLNGFCASALPALERRSKVEKPDFLSQFEPKPCILKFYLDEQEGEITAAVYAEYGEEKYNLIQPATVEEASRDVERENMAAGIIRRYFSLVDVKRGIYVLPETEEDLVYGLVSDGIGILQQMGEVYITDRLKAIKVYRSPKMSVGVSLSGGMLDITLNMEQFSAGELAQILSGYKRKKRFYRLKDGSFLTMEDNALAVMTEMAEGLELDIGELEKGSVHVPEYRAFYLDQLLREQNSDIEVRKNRDYRALLRDFKNVEDCDFEVPKNLHAELRPYQKFGYKWMCTLDHLGFGGILADDMGLGKTVQAIGFLLAGKEYNTKDNRTPAITQEGAGFREESDGTKEKEEEKENRYGLIVCPASLVYNWESEIHRFAPDLTVVPVVGTAPVRKQLIQSGKNVDILLTSYDLLKRDGEWYEKLSFHYMIIDEAQNIKNHLTLAAKAVKGISSKRRFALTGTPIENSLSELWSIFDYLMPGILNSYKRFKENYEQPIVSSLDEQITVRLQRMIRPFVLRRLKSQVLKELPDKLEEVVYSRMEEEQRKLYEANIQELVHSLKKQSAEEFQTGKIQILAALTRLRQLCCDPGLVYEGYHGGSAKVDTCMELIRNAAAAGNQVLVFSQFTQALDILKELLDQEKIGCYLFTGSVSKEKRAEMVRSFNEDKTPVFLISLKAGGTGLNLTSASIVIHFDPWWNMAAQNQATDRAHRIGQKQVVTVYKLIMKDTLEEKILRLQERKAHLSDEIISDGSIRDVLATKEEFMEILGV
ncbi:hypothetical protein D3Z55_16405 [Clostridiaceae bacterium]|nr:hypothetical protein [Clostridiaceae bacterium]